jgi:LacI family transcriptional regulator
LTSQNATRSSVNLRDVADRAGVALSSASRVLTAHPNVSPKMRRRVLRAAEELGYEPNALARGLRRGATLTIGFVVRDISNPVFAEIGLAAETALRAAGYLMLLANSEGNPALDAEHLLAFRQRRADGLLLSLADESDVRTLEQLSKLAVPYVLVDRELAGAQSHSAVLADQAGGARMATEHLLGLGHRRIALVGAPQSIRPGRELAAGLRSACGAYPDAHAIVEAVPFTEAEGLEALGRLLDAPKPPTAFLISANRLLPAALRMFHERGVAIPRDVSVVTFDGGPLMDLLSPAIANVRRSPDMLGRKAAELLLRLFRGGEPERLIVPATFHPGTSCAPPPPG